MTFNIPRAVVILTVLLAVLFLGVGERRSAWRVGYVGSGGWRSWAGRYTLLDGKMIKTLRPKGKVLHMEVNTESGTLSVEIRDGDGRVLFSEKDMGTQSCDLAVSGKVSIRLDAEQHKGSFRFEGYSSG